jgi:GC-rich sequence DNA-binding factor
VMRERSAKHGRDLAAAVRAVQTLQEEGKELESNMSDSNEQYLFYQKVQEEVADQLDCLSSKDQLITRCHERLEGIYAARQTAREEQAKLHAQDMKREAFGEDSSQAQEEEEKQGMVDDFGRDISYEYTHGASKRAQQREERRTRRAKQGKGRVEEEGWSTEEEEESNYTAQVAAVREDALHIFEDVREEYANLTHIKGVMEGWKARYPNAYNDAFIALSVPSLFAPYARLECVQWDALKTPAFDALPCYSQLFSFGVTDDTPEDDPDWNLVPKLMEKTVLPFLAGVVFKREFDPLSHAHAQAALELLRECHSHVEEGVPARNELDKAVLSCLAQAVHDHTSLPVLPIHAAATEAQIAFCARRWWRALKLLQTLMILGGEEEEGMEWADCLALASSHVTDSLLPFLCFQLAQDQDQGQATTHTKAKQMCSRFCAVCPAPFLSRLRKRDARGFFLGLYTACDQYASAQPQSSQFFMASKAIVDLQRRR